MFKHHFFPPHQDGFGTQAMNRIQDGDPEHNEQEQNNSVKRDPSVDPLRSLAEDIEEWKKKSDVTSGNDNEKNVADEENAQLVRSPPFYSYCDVNHSIRNTRDWFALIRIVFCML